MKKILKYMIVLSGLILTVSCNDYLSDIPKGQKTPTTFVDYDAFINFSDQLYMEIEQTSILMNEYFRSTSALNSNELSKANYFWDETVDRTLINSKDYAYSRAYEGIFYWNLIVDYAGNATECTESERLALVAQGRVLRDITYFYVANYFADVYDETTLDKLCVPLVKSSSTDAPSPQVTIGELYDFLVEDLEKAIPDLPATGSNMFHPSKAAGYGLLARVQLMMGNYEDALKNAESALALNSQLFSWVDYYNADKERFDDPTNYTSSAISSYGNPEINNVENYFFKYPSMMFYNGNYGSGYYALSADRAAQFEKGDTRLLTHWKYRYSTSLGDYYYGIYAILPNKGGIRSSEMYYIKAECLARTGNVSQAMNVLNTVRATRILPEYYEELTASSEVEAVKKITDDKFNEFIQNIVSFADRKRLNKDSLYQKTLTKTVNGVTYQISPDSHLWIMPFPESVINNPGNATITQNTTK